MRYVRRFLKRLWLKLGGCVIEYCHTCGRRQPLIWKVSDALWARVTGRSDGGGVSCPNCFDRKARKMGIVLRWTAEAEGEGVKAPVGRFMYFNDSAFRRAIDRAVKALARLRRRRRRRSTQRPRRSRSRG